MVADGDFHFQPVAVYPEFTGDIFDARPFFVRIPVRRPAHVRRFEQDIFRSVRGNRSDCPYDPDAKILDPPACSAPFSIVAFLIQPISGV